LRVTFLDVGQGDAILLAPRGRPPTLVDAGPPGADVAERLDELGVGRLDALVATHPEADHVGGAAEVLEAHPAARLLFARLDPVTRAAARSSGAAPTRIAAGDHWHAGGMRVDVLWPPPTRLTAARGHAGTQAGDPNELALVLLVHWGRFELLLPADAEAELAPLDPGPVDVLKVAHHGSDDAGLAGLLADAEPRLAVISVGAGNSYGHPTQRTLATLAEAGADVMRTDVDGEVALDVARRRWWVR
jgi:competence protein ComEC